MKIAALDSDTLWGVSARHFVHNRRYEKLAVMKDFHPPTDVRFESFHETSYIPKLPKLPMSPMPDPATEVKSMPPRSVEAPNPPPPPIPPIPA